MKLTDHAKDLILRWLLLTAYAAATLVLVLRHEPWADELQAWLIARDSTVPEIFSAMRWEGHFVPWYLMLHVFAANGAPVLCMNLLSWAFLTAAGAFFIFRAPFNIPLKSLVLCSSGMLFWDPVVARCYAPIPLLLFLLASVWSQRLTRPLLFGFLIALLTNTHAYFEGFCGAVFAIWAYDAWKNRPTLSGKNLKRIVGGMAIAAAGALFGFAQVAPGVFSARSVGNQRFWPMKMNFFERLATSFVDFAGSSKEVANVHFPPLEYLWAALAIVLIVWFVRRRRTALLYLVLAAVIFPALYFFLPPQDHPFQSGFQLILDFVFLPFFAVAVLTLFRASKRMGILCLASFLWMIVFAMFLFYFLPQRALLVFLIYLFCVWIVRENPDEAVPADGKFYRVWEGPHPPSPLLRLMEILILYVCVTLPACVSFAVQDYRHPFAGAKDMGEYLTKTLPPGSTVILPYYGITDAVISAYAPGLKFYCIESGRNITFCPLDWSLEEVKRRSSLIVPDWIKEKNDEYITLIDQTGFMYSPIWEPVLEEPGPHYFVCSMRYLQALWGNPIKLQSKDRRRTFTEIYRSPRIWFTAVAGEQYWLFTDEPARADEVQAAAPGTH